MQVSVGVYEMRARFTSAAALLHISVCVKYVHVSRVQQPYLRWKACLQGQIPSSSFCLNSSRHTAQIWKQSRAVLQTGSSSHCAAVVLALFCVHGLETTQPMSASQTEPAVVQINNPGPKNPSRVTDRLCAVMQLLCRPSFVI